MKLYFAVIDEVGNTHSSVSTGTAMELLKQVFISLPTAEFDLSNPRIKDRVEEIDELFRVAFEGLETPIQVIDAISEVLTHKPVDMQAAEPLAETLMIFELADDGPDLAQFLQDLRNIFKGEVYDLSAMTESQTSLIVRIEM